MTESVADVVLFGLSLALPLGLFGLRQSVLRLRPDAGGRLQELLSPGNAAALSGIVIGLTVLPEIARVIDGSASLLILVISAWCGFTVGSGIELRALRKTSSVVLASQLGQCIVAILLIPILTYTLAHLPWEIRSVFFAPGVLIIAIGMCLSDRVVGHPGRRHGPRPSGKGFPKPSMAACVAILLAAFGGGFDPVGSTYVAGLPFLSWPSITWSISGVGERAFLGLAMGCAAGLLCDLAAKDHSSTGATFSVFSAVFLVVGGIALAFGIQPLLIGVIGGAWVINATLRRLDVHQVIESSARLSSIGVPFLLGWSLGYGIVVHGISEQALLVAVCLILLVRPIVRIAGWRLGEYLMKAKTPLPLSRQGESLPFDTSGFLIALVVVILISGPAEVGFLAAVLICQVVFAEAARWSPETPSQTRRVT